MNFCVTIDRDQRTIAVSWLLNLLAKELWQPSRRALLISWLSLLSLSKKLTSRSTEGQASTVTPQLRRSVSDFGSHLFIESPYPFVWQTRCKLRLNISNWSIQVMAPQ